MRFPAFELRCQYVFDVHGVRNFFPKEVAPIGRVAYRDGRPVLVEGKPVKLLAPQPRNLLHALLIVRVLDRLRAREGDRPVGVHSWFRDRIYNAAVGGAPASTHLTALGVDIALAHRSPVEVGRSLLLDPDADRLGIKVYNSFVHVDGRGLVSPPRPPWRDAVPEIGEWWK